MKKIIVLSLGGSLICPDKPDYFFLREFKNFIISKINKFTFIIVCGGGKVNSYYNEAAQRISNINKFDLDLIGIRATKLNAELVRAIFQELAYKKVIETPNSVIFKKITNYQNSVYVVSGWKPGNSSDYVSVLISKKVKSDMIINLTNIDYVYDKDPKIDNNAKKIEKIQWRDFRKIIGNEWSPRMNTPFDPIASREAEKLKLKVLILNGRNLKNLDNSIEEKDFIGTLIY